MASQRAKFFDSDAYKRGLSARVNGLRVPNPYRWPTDAFISYDKGFYEGRTMTDDISVLPYQNGLLAAEQGKDRKTDNPYPLATKNSEDWLNGFNSYIKPEKPAK